MTTQVKTKTSELGDSRVRVEVEVEPAAVDRAVSEAAVNLGRDLKIPGFRKGKVPPQVVLQRVGRPTRCSTTCGGTLPLRKPGIFKSRPRFTAASLTALSTAAGSTSTSTRTRESPSSLVFVFTWVVMSPATIA